MLELSDEHGRHTIKRSTALFVNRAETSFGIKRLGRQNNGASVSECGQTAQDTPKAMIEGHRQANAITASVFEALSGEEAIIQDVVMRKRGTLGNSSRAGSVLDADRIVELQRIFAGTQIRCGYRVCICAEILPIQRVSLSMKTDIHHQLERR